MSSEEHVVDDYIPKKFGSYVTNGGLPAVAKAGLLAQLLWHD